MTKRNLQTGAATFSIEPSASKSGVWGEAYLVKVEDAALLLSSVRYYLNGVSTM